MQRFVHADKPSRNRVPDGNTHWVSKLVPFAQPYGNTELTATHKHTHTHTHTHAWLLTATTDTAPCSAQKSSTRSSRCIVAPKIPRVTSSQSSTPCCSAKPALLAASAKRQCRCVLWWCSRQLVVLDIRADTWWLTLAVPLSRCRTTTHLVVQGHRGMLA